MANDDNSYENTAEQIISKAIKSVLFIDDELLEPFADPGDGSLELSKGFYDSFKENNCSLDFYKFVNEKDWNEQGNSILNSKDLLILDWQLQKEAPEFGPALKIISEAIKKQNLHFVYIYTDSKDFNGIVYKINSYFSPFKRTDLQEIEEGLSQLLKPEGFSLDAIFSDVVRARLAEMIIYQDRAGEIFSDVKEISEFALLLLRIRNITKQGRIGASSIFASIRNTELCFEKFFEGAPYNYSDRKQRKN